MSPQKPLLQFRTLALALLLSAAVAPSRAAEPVRAPAGSRLEKMHEQDHIQVFTWDENASLWFVSVSDDLLLVNTLSPDGTTSRLAGSIQRRGNIRPGLLVHAEIAYLSDGDSIRTFQIDPNGKLREQGSLRFLPSLFPSRSQITSMRWSLLGGLTFQYQSASDGETGIGRLDLKNARWDILAKGISGPVASDHDGFLLAADVPSSSLFRVALGLDYAKGLHNFGKTDLALPTSLPVKPSALVFHAGSWLVSDSESSALLQFRESNGVLTFQRELAKWEKNWSIADLQFGPDQSVWLLAESSTTNRIQAAIYRLPSKEAPCLSQPFTDFSTEAAAGELKSSNPWRREAALRVLERRDDLLSARGLHPATPLHSLWSDPASDARARSFVLLGLHRAGLLDDTWLENGADDTNTVVRAWTALLFGERSYPTATTFQRLEKMAQETNLFVRGAAAVAARQLVSSTLAIDTPPRSIPIREVFTGGILSTLWFSTEKGSSPEFELLYWNAVRPIVAFDAAHPLGFFQQEDDGLPISPWIVARIAEQLAIMTDPLKQEDGLLMLKNMKNQAFVIAALQGLKNGTPNRKVAASAGSIAVLEAFSKHSNPELSALAAELMNLWSERQPK